MVTTEHLRDRYYRDPFEPFEIVLHDGRTLTVRSNLHYAISPIGRDMVFAPTMAEFELIDMSEIAELRTVEPAGV